MRGIRGARPSDDTRAQVAQRLADLAADLDDEGPLAAAGPLPAPLPVPGRHAGRRVSPRLPVRLASGLTRPVGIGVGQLAVVAVLVAMAVALAAWWVVRDQAEPVPAAPTVPVVQPLVAPVEGSVVPSASSGTTGTVTVDVTGKVRRPGIVVLDAGARVVDALEAAGGERGGVDLSTLNLARVLVDGEQIVVGGAPGSTVAPPGATASGAPGPPGAPTALINLNTATQPELEALPDVGPVTAQAIVAWRDEHGGFSSVDELLEVDGIGDVTLEKLAPLVTV